MISQTVRDRAFSQTIEDVTSGLNREVVPALKTARAEVNKMLEGPFAPTDVTAGTVTVDFGQHPVFGATLIADVTSFVFKAPALDRCVLTLILYTEATGYSVDGFASNVIFGCTINTNATPPFAIASNSALILRFYYDGANYLAL